MSTLLSLQTSGGVTPAQWQFAQLDANSDGSVTESELDAHFAAANDPATVSAAFGAIDTNGDGSISESEFTSARHADEAYHLHHVVDSVRTALGGGSSAGATSQTTSNPDGSSSTTITYADGSTVTMTTPASGTSGADSTSGPNTNNLIEQLIQMQAQLLAPTAATSVTTA